MTTISVFSDASFSHSTNAGGGAFLIRAGGLEDSASFSFVGAEQSHDAEIIAACTAITSIAEDAQLGPELAKGPRTRVELVVDCLAIGQVLVQGTRPKMSSATLKSVREVRTLQKNLKFSMKVRHVKAHSGTETPWQVANTWCDLNARRCMRELQKELLH